jgi:hypothetical protein
MAPIDSAKGAGAAREDSPKILLPGGGETFDFGGFGVHWKLERNHILPKKSSSSSNSSISSPRITFVWTRSNFAGS